MLMEVREITGMTSISSVDIRDMLLGNAWREKVVGMVYKSRSNLKLFARAPVDQMRCDQFFKSLFTRPRPWLRVGLLMTVTCDNLRLGVDALRLNTWML